MRPGVNRRRDVTYPEVALSGVENLQSQANCRVLWVIEALDTLRSVHNERALDRR